MRKGGKIIKGMGQGFSILRRFSPDVIVGFGSFYTLPVLLAALIRKVPIVLHEQNAIPGKVNRLFSRFAHTTAITFPESAYYLKGNKVEVTFPLSKRKEVSAWDYFALTPGKPTLLIFGGSQGAYQLNALFLESVDKIVFPVQILHFTGKHGSVDEAKKRYKTLGIPHCVKEFEPCMHAALQIADMALSRAGAATISELIETETPAILIPFPFASENHQEKNGEHFVKKVQGGWMHLEKTLTAEKLAKSITQFLEKELLVKKKNIQSFKKEHQIYELSHLILNMGLKRGLVG